MINLTSGTDVQAARRLCGLTQAQLAAAIGIHQSNIGKVEGYAVVPYKMRTRIEAVLGPLMPAVYQGALAAARADVLKAFDRYHALALQLEGKPAPTPARVPVSYVQDADGTEHPVYAPASPIAAAAPSRAVPLGQGDSELDKLFASGTLK